MAFFKNLFTRKPKNRFSFEQLEYLYGIIKMNQTITETNSKLLVETLREISELMIWGDQHNERFFDWFLEKNIIGWFLKFLSQHSPTAIKIQLLQTLSIMIENIKSEKSIYFLLSNNHINSIITHRFDFSNEEVLAYYISFLKALSLKVNNKTIKLFYNLNTKEMPLYSESINFFNHPDGMVRIAVRTITLNIFRVDFKPSRDLILNSKKIPYFNNLVWFIRMNCLSIEEELQSNNISTKILDDKLFSQLDDFYYLEDIFNLQITELNSTLAISLRKNLFIPIFIESFVGSTIKENSETNKDQFTIYQNVNTKVEKIKKNLLNEKVENKETSNIKIEAPQKIENGKGLYITSLDNKQQKKKELNIENEIHQKLESISNEKVNLDQNNFFSLTDSDLNIPQKHKITRKRPKKCSQILSLCLLSQIFHVISCSKIIVPLLTILLNPQSNFEKILEQSDMEIEEFKKNKQIKKVVNKNVPLFEITLSGNDIFDEQKNDKDLKTSLLIVDFSHKLITNIIFNIINNKGKKKKKKKKKKMENNKKKTLFSKNKNFENKNNNEFLIKEIKRGEERGKKGGRGKGNGEGEENVNVIRSQIISFLDDENERIVFFTLCFFYSICKQIKNSKPLLECIDVFPVKYRGSQKLLEELSIFDEDFEIKTKLLNPPKHQFSLFNFNSPKKKNLINHNEKKSNQKNLDYSFWIVEKILNIFFKKQHYCFVTFQVCIKLLIELVYDSRKSPPYLNIKHLSLLDNAYLLSIKKLQKNIVKNPIGNLFMDLFHDEYEKSLRYSINFEKIISDPELLMKMPESQFSGVDLSKRGASDKVEKTVKNMKLFFMLRRLRNNLLGKKEINLPLNEPENDITYKVSQKVESLGKNIIPCYVNKTQMFQKVGQKYLIIENSHFLLLKPNQLDHGKTAVIKYKWDLRDIRFSLVDDEIMKFRILKGKKRLIKNKKKLEAKRFVKSEFLLYFGKKMYINATKREINRELNSIHSKKLSLLKDLIDLEVKEITQKFIYSKK
ncbi:hypothetical protein M0813_28098 [Anaeramoeba flamelloides]|uniref:FPL domain-containing protein n=1 Tax=Anaeramoeba flamelloides TaxID=1746091 RepID=A0ABQ8XUE8_9EUKA|nr:hypothetical protein M0813_28098 [Anaeramoeba flamelloides]